MATDINPALFDSMGADYEKAFGHDPGLHKFIEKVLALLPPSSKVLDVGCGTGRPVSSTLASNGHKVTGIDISPSMAELSRKAVPSGEFEVADMTKYVPKDKMNAIFNILCLFWLDRKGMEDQCKKWHEWLLPGGIVCICTFGAEDLHPTKEMYDEDGLCASGMEFLFMGRKAQLLLMTKEGWKRILEAAGFEIVETLEDYFQPKGDTQEEFHHFIIARKVR